MIEALARRALASWGLQGAELTLVAQRENSVYRVTPAGRAALALRLHRPGLRSDAELRSELQWMEALARGGLTLPRPIPTEAGSLCTRIDGTVVDLLTWLEGAPMGKDGRLSPLPDPLAAYRALGQAMAELHDISDGWTPPSGFSRPSWNLDGLLGDKPLWGRFWNNPQLREAEAGLLQRARSAALTRLTAATPTLDFGLIHADLVPENVLFLGHRPQLIDFDDSGFGFRLFDLATVLNRALRDDDYAPRRDAMLSGYQSRRAIDLTDLPLFQALRAFTYVGWIVPRTDEPGAEARCKRFIALACRMAAEMLGE